MTHYSHVPCLHAGPGQEGWWASRRPGRSLHKLGRRRQHILHTLPSAPHRDTFLIPTPGAEDTAQETRRWTHRTQHARQAFWVSSQPEKWHRCLRDFLPGNRPSGTQNSHNAWPLHTQTLSQGSGVEGLKRGPCPTTRWTTHQKQGHTISAGGKSLWICQHHLGQPVLWQILRG